MSLVSQGPVGTLVGVARRGILLERVVEGRQVFNQGREILAGKAEHAGGGEGADGRRTAPVTEDRDLAEMIAGPELSNHPLLTVGPLEHLDLA